MELVPLPTILGKPSSFIVVPKGRIGSGKLQLAMPRYAAAIARTQQASCPHEVLAGLRVHDLKVPNYVSTSCFCCCLATSHGPWAMSLWLGCGRGVQSAARLATTPLLLLSRETRDASHWAMMSSAPLGYWLSHRWWRSC